MVLAYHPSVRPLWHCFRSEA